MRQYVYIAHFVFSHGVNSFAMMILCETLCFEDQTTQLICTFYAYVDNMFANVDNGLVYKLKIEI